MLELASAPRAAVAEVGRTATPTACRICARAGSHQVFTAREMMFGLRDRFEYFRCSGCGCLQIAAVPPDMDRYYPPGYYSLSQPATARPRNPLLRALREIRDRRAVGGTGMLGAWLLSRFPYPELTSLSRIPGLSRASRVLDVGCGTGALLYTLGERGFRNVLGLDPFLARDLEYPNGARVLRRTLDQAVGEWDVVMFQHSFEHLPDPARALGNVARLLAPGGCCLVRMPVVPCYAWEQYGVDWIQLDAPRHLFIHSVESVRLMASSVAMGVREVVHDSTAFQLWGSEQYRQDIPLFSERSHQVHPERSIFSRAHLREFRRQAAALNAAGCGDQVALYLARD